MTFNYKQTSMIRMHQQNGANISSERKNIKMKLNVSASELAESLKLKTNENSVNTELSNLIDQCDEAMGEFLGYAETRDKQYVDIMRINVENYMMAIVEHIHNA